MSTFADPLFDTLTSARTLYPIPLMIGMQITQSGVFRAENSGRKHPTELVAMIARFILSYCCYCYAGSIVVEPLLINRFPTMMSRPNAVMLWFLILSLGHFSATAWIYDKVFAHPVVKNCAKFVFFLDFTRIGYNMLEGVDKVANASGHPPHRRATLLVFMALLFACAPAIMKGMFYGKNRGWVAEDKDHEKVSSVSMWFLLNRRPIIQIAGMLYYWVVVCYGTDIEGLVKFFFRSVVFDAHSPSSTGSGSDVCPSKSLSECAERRKGLYAESVLLVAVIYFLVDEVAGRVVLGGRGSALKKKQ